ncbi:MAG TPA: divalent-cation tolerance protein CutA [candidate division WOR-3 bacterium]|uniref:Divalent-cation tolerance protein CutA n=1 Tax=candidate division WOR-3 bacterium TaxID=2052148 RepID=A0A9C9EKI3_UNCW3|nr:divalent-cation tolerance protein CutA [candidate division WOR-3 bacterium]
MKIEKIVIYTTFPDLKTAKHIINGLVKEKLAACGNIFKLQSIFTWQEKIEEESEYGAFIKTRKSHYKKVEQYIKDNHPYEVPEIISWGIQNGLDAYLDWVEKETAD